MPGFLIRVLVTAFGLWLAETLLPGVTIDDAVTLLLAALLLGVVNAFVRPLVVFFTLPLTLVTLGLFLFVVNGLMIGLVAAMLGGFHVAGLFSAILASLIVGLVSWIASWTIGSGGRYEVMVVRS